MSLWQSIRPRVPLIAAGAVFILAILASIDAANVIGAVTVFARNGASVHFGQFYDESSRNVIAFSEGQSGPGLVNVERNGRPIAPAVETEKVRLFNAFAGDSVCAERTCVALRSNGRLATLKGDNPWWSTRAVTLQTWDSLPATSYNLRSNTAEDLLMVAEHDFHSQTVALVSGLNHVKAPTIGRIEPWRLGYTIGFAAFCAVLCALLVVRARAILGAITLAPAFTAALALQLSLQYLCVFPGMFATDSIVNDVHSEEFNIWFSPAFMIYSIIISPLHPLGIQLPGILLYFSVCLFLGMQLNRLPGGRPWLWVFFAFQLISPAIFTALFVQQRIFVAALLVISGIVVSFIRVANSQSVGAIGYGLLMTASLMRIEYAAFLVAFLVFDCRTSINIRAKLYKVAAVLSVFALSSITVNKVIPSLYGVNLRVKSAQYSLASSLDIVRPYVNCNAPDGPIVDAIRSLGRVEAYCENTTQRFFWDVVMSAPQGPILDSAHKIMHSLVPLIKADPAPEIERVAKRFADMITQPPSDIYNRYVHKTDDAGRYHSLIVDRFGFVPDYPWQAPLLHFAVTAYGSVASMQTNVIWAIFVFIFVYVLCRDRRILILNAAVVCVTCAVSFASPTVYWPYIIIVPLWGVFAIPLDVLASKLRAGAEAHRDPVEREAQCTATP